VNPTGISETLMKVRPGVEISGQSDIGCQRENNEDSFGYWEPEDDEQFLRKGRLAIVADGMEATKGARKPVTWRLKPCLRFTATRTATIRNGH